MNIRPFFRAAVLAAVSAVSGMAQDADTNTTGADASGAAAPAQSGGGMRGRLNFLSADDRQHLLKVRTQTLAENPALKTEQENLRQQWQAAKSGGTGDKQALRGQMRDFHEKMEAAMVKTDPSVQPILDQIKAHMKARFQQGAGASGDDGGNQ